MQLTYLEQIEQKYSFRYPDLYKQLCKDGMLDTGEYGQGWIERNYERIKDNPIYLIWSNDVELTEEFGIEEGIDDIKDPEIWYVKPDLKLIPFAQNGGGDWYCFYYNEQLGDDVPVSLVYHDDDQLVVMAKNIQDFTFRVLVETASDFYLTTFDEEELNKNVQDARLMVNSHKRYLTESQIVILNDIYSRELKEQGQNTWGFISEEECRRIIKQEIDFPLLNKEFQYTDEE